MIRSAHDDREASALLYLIDSLTDGEYQVVYDTVRRITEWSPKLHFRPSLLCVVNEKVKMPTPTQRARMAEETGAKDYNPFLAVATTGFVPRALLTAIKWMQGKTSRWTLGAYPTVSQAVDWLELERKAPLPALRRMITQLDAHL